MKKRNRLIYVILLFLFLTYDSFSQYSVSSKLIENDKDYYFFYFNENNINRYTNLESVKVYVPNNNSRDLKKIKKRVKLAGLITLGAGIGVYAWSWSTNKKYEGYKSDIISETNTFTQAQLIEDDVERKKILDNANKQLVASKILLITGGVVFGFSIMIDG